VSGHLNPGGQQFRGDRGAADSRVAAALAAYQAGRGSEQAALGALATARLLVPVVAVLADGPASGDKNGDKNADENANKNADENADKNSEMMLPTLIGRDGRPAVLAFTGLDALARWRPDARPVPAGADRVWRAAAADGCAVVIDVAGPVPLAIEGARLAALAAGQPVPPPHEDPDVRAEVQAAVAGERALAGFTLAPGRGEGTDLAVTLHVAGTREWGPAVHRAAAAIAARLGARLRRGIEVVVAD
jgi:SseB protein N-terminal domain